MAGLFVPINTYPALAPTGDLVRDDLGAGDFDLALSGADLDLDFSRFGDLDLDFLPCGDFDLDFLPRGDFDLDFLCRGDLDRDFLLRGDLDRDFLRRGDLERDLCLGDFDRDLLRGEMERLRRVGESRRGVTIFDRHDKDLIGDIDLRCGGDRLRIGDLRIGDLLRELM